MFISFTDAAAIIVALTCARLLRAWSKRYRGVKLPYPPGPKGLPIIGNFLDMPGENEWEVAQQWGATYGPLVFVKNFGKPILFLNSYEVMVDLLEKRGSLYSSRPQNTMLDLEGWTDWFIALFPYGDELRRSRQLLYRYFHSSVVPEYHGVQEFTTHKLLYRLLKSPDDFIRHIRQTAGESILMVTYGYQAAEENDPYIEIAEKGMEAFTEAEGFFLVNLVPWLQYLPSWFPGASFINLAKEGYRSGMDMYLKPHEMSKKLIEGGNAIPSVSSKLFDSHRDENGKIIDEEFLAKVSGIVYGAGADTIVSSMATFVLAMVLHPEVMKRGQEELDRVVGKNTLPTLKDKNSLPYIEAILKECTRWQVVAPLAVAHVLTEDDEYNGYLIPAGTIVYPNLWAALRDPTMYPNPDEFIPERWLPLDGKEPPIDSNRLGFGVGRRICPGRYFAENSLFISIASVLAAFDIKKAKGEDGISITPSREYISSFIRHPKPFECAITPRNDEIATLVKHMVETEFST